jgi:MFS family permease
MKSRPNTWLNLAVLIGAGVAVAMQIGKVPASLPALQTDLGMSLFQSVWVVAIFSILAAGFAGFLGIFSDRSSQLVPVMSGMLLTATAGIAGGFVTGGNALLVTRVFEGLGFLLTTTAVPLLILRAVSEHNRKTALALWGMYLPLGSGLMMAISGVLLTVFDWRVLWWVTAGLILIAAVPVYFVGGRIGSHPRQTTDRPGFKEVLRDSCRPGPILLGMIFSVYGAQYLIVAGFLPSILMELNGFSAFAAATTGAIAVFSNVLGNGVSGFLHSRGYRSLVLILIGCLGMASASVFIFSQGISGEARAFAAALFCALAGLVPSSLFSELPRNTPQRAGTATIGGMLVQGSAFGQLTGPPVVAAFVSYFGTWSVATPLMITAAAFAAICTIVLSKIGGH